MLRPTDIQKDRVLKGQIKLMRPIQYETGNAAYCSRGELFMAVVANPSDTNTDVMNVNFNISYTDV